MQAKKIIIPAIAIGILAVGIFGWASITRADATSSPNNKQTIIDKLVKKFNLKESDVQAVFDETRQERQTQMQKEHQSLLEKRLDKAVKDGVISEAQKQKLLTKFSDLQKQRQQEMTDLQNWFKDNDIDQDKLKPYMGLGEGMGMHMGRFHGRGHGSWR